MINFKKLPFEKYIEEQKKYGLDQLTLFRNIRTGKAPLNFEADNKKLARRIASRLLKRYGNREGYQIMYRKSSGRKGYHFTIFKNGKQLFLNIKKVIKIREAVGDCFGRLECDRLRAKRGLPIGILFHHKNRKDATNYRELKFLKFRC